jgi:hypothetical protein
MPTVTRVVRILYVRGYKTMGDILEIDKKSL